MRPSPVFFDIAVTVAFLVFAIGIVYKLLAWFFKNVGMGDKTVSISRRLFHSFEGIVLAVFSSSFFAMIKALVTDVLLQFRILADRKDPSAWIMHLLIFVGFVGLVVLHAFNLPASFSSDYYSTTNPLMFLRNFLGVLVLVGLVLAVVRRSVWMKGRIRTSGADVYGLAVVAVIIISGFFLETLKITSYAEYDRMVDEYGAGLDEDEARSLEAYWVKHFSVVSPTMKEPLSEELVAQGAEVHEMSCVECHDRPESAFLSFALVTITKPLALRLDEADIRVIMWYVHILSCLIGLALLPFTKLFHILSTPISLVVAELSKSKQEPASVATRQVVELDGCSHGGACHTSCPVRRRRQARIERMIRYRPALEYLETKACEDLGSRQVTT